MHPFPPHSRAGFVDYYVGGELKVKDASLTMRGAALELRGVDRTRHVASPRALYK